MRILLITDWNRGRGGAEAYALWLRQGLRAAGDDARLLTSSAGTAAEGTADFVAFGTERMVAQAFLQISNPFAASSVRRAVHQFEPDIACVNMFAHHLSPAIFHALGATPTVLLVSDYKCVCPIGSKLLPDGSLCTVKAGWVCCQSGCVSLPHWLRDQLRYSYINSAVRGVSRVVACSRWLQGELAAAGIAADVLPWPVPSPAPDFVRSPAPDPVFLFCGRLDVEKGVSLLLRAFARLRAEIPSARLRIVGQGPGRLELERIAGALGLEDSVTFLGWLSPPEIEHQLRDAWASLIPSLWAEPFGLVAVEAIIRGVPVIASASGGLSEILEQGVSGLLFPNNDEAALIDCLRAAANGFAFPARTLSHDVVKRAAETFSIERHIRQMREVFAEVAEQRDAAPS
jgi:glycosyltransferase involved in cell wall biosynthesis